MEPATETQKEDETANTSSSSKSNAPPAVITVDTTPSATKDGDASQIPKSEAASQARTPKHANKLAREERKGSEFESESRRKSLFKSGPPPYHHSSGYGHPGESYRTRHSYPPVHGNPAIHVSPTGAGGPGYYGGYGRGPPGGYPQYDRYHGDYPRFDGGHGYQQGPPPHYRMPMYPPRPYPGGEYSSRPSWGPPGHYPHSRHHHPPSPHQSGSSTFSRAVSSSFDRSIKSRESKGHGMDAHSGSVNHGHDDSHSISDETSWKMLNQVHSVDEEEMHRRVQRDGAGPVDDHPRSTSSSLTNSPTEGIDSKKNTGPDANKLSSSLDSLSSVASAQEPMDTEKKPLSPSESTGSLDLMKCPSGGSNLLLPSHQRSLSQFSLPAPENLIDTNLKRSREDDGNQVEDREELNTEGKDDAELRRAPSEEEPQAKRKRPDSKHRKKGSPLSITCSPPTSPNPGEKKKGETTVHQPQPVYPPKEHQSPGFYDHPPSYSYSMESAPHLPSDRPSSRGDDSMTPTPMNVDSDAKGPPAVSQLPSWEIQAQDSFGGGNSVSGGTGLMSSFSFREEYPMLSASASLDNGSHYPSRERDHPAVETRNQSFDSQYGGNFGRSDSMMSYERHGPYDGRQGYPQQFPPHAPSWGSNASYHSGPVYPPYRGHYPPMMRNYSEDSAARSTPPPGGMRMLPPGFQPPPEFLAPPSRVKQNVQENTIMTSPYNPSPKTGPFGWTKEEDARLTEVMKKYKNPRDWEPIAKDHNRGRTAKECHERWIRYLKPGVRKGQWTDHEDAIVMEAVTTSSEQPFTRWSDLAQRLPGRVGKQIRDRWVNHLNPAINHLPFSREDDLLLWDGHKRLGKRWVEIATKFFNSTRSENHIKNRWYSASFKKFISNEFGPDAYSGGKKKDKSSSEVSGEKATSKKKRKDSSPRRPLSESSEMDV